MRETREDRKQRLSLKAQNAINKRWADYHATCPTPIYDMPRLDDEYEITVKNFSTGETHSIMLHPGPRRDNFFADLDGNPWRVVSHSFLMQNIRKRLVKGKSGRVI